MYSTTTIIKNSKLTGRVVGTHQQLDIAARKALNKVLPSGKYFPSAKEIIHFEGTRGPDGLKRKSPGIDEPSHMLVDGSVYTLISDHHWNLIQALKESNRVRAAFETAWLAHMIADGLTPAHHFPLGKVKDELMTDKELVHLFGQPIKGVMHGRSLLETMRNNWLYWGAGGHMTKHIAYEYGVLMIAATLPNRAITPKLTKSDFQNVDLEKIFNHSLEIIKNQNMYTRFLTEGWTTDLAVDTKKILLPEIVKCITLCWNSAVQNAYEIKLKGASDVQK